MIKNFLVLISLIVINGCAVTAKGPLFEQEGTQIDDAATVYIYRLELPSHSLPVLQPSIFVDGEPLFRLPQKGYGVVHLKKGEYLFETRKEGNTISIEVESKNEIEIKSLRSHYTRWLPVHKGTEAYYNVVTMVTFVSDFGGVFEFIPEEIALKEISSMRKVYPK
ncbi:MAG: DUF2846 domain-containing protein [Gammaproteobacteria bacterium]|nr:DUF2846 domain-containing protein [Gammaproteobacteria bacterium]